MKSITIHKLSDDVAVAIERIAKQTGLSQNKVIKKLLKKALNLDNGEPVKEDFSEFLGVWNIEEEKAFNEAIASLEKVDEDMWQ